MYNAIRCCFILIALFSSLILFAQGNPEMADTMRSNGKIYVVVSVCLIILIGLFLYVWGIDRKIRIIEKEKVE